MLENERDWLDSLRLRCGMPALAHMRTWRGEKHLESYECLKASQWSTAFEAHMRNRLIMGGLRYGHIGKKRGKLDRAGSIIRRAKAYQLTGNQEHLVDIANEALLEFIEPMGHDNPHFSPSDDGEVHTEGL